MADLGLRKKKKTTSVFKTLQKQCIDGRLPERAATAAEREVLSLQTEVPGRAEVPKAEAGGGSPGRAGSAAPAPGPRRSANWGHGKKRKLTSCLLSERPEVSKSRLRRKPAVVRPRRACADGGVRDRPAS